MGFVADCCTVQSGFSGFSSAAKNLQVFLRRLSTKRTHLCFRVSRWQSITCAALHVFDPRKNEPIFSRRGRTVASCGLQSCGAAPEGSPWREPWVARVEFASPGRGDRTFGDRTRSFRRSAARINAVVPTACAVGYLLPPLRGCAFNLAAPNCFKIPVAFTRFFVSLLGLSGSLPRRSMAKAGAGKETVLCRSRVGVGLARRSAAKADQNNIENNPVFRGMLWKCSGGL